MIERKTGVVEAGTAVTKAVEPAKTEIAPTKSSLFGIPVPRRPDSIIPIKQPDLGRMPNPNDYVLERLLQDLQKEANDKARKVGGVKLLFVEFKGRLQQNLQRGIGKDKRTRSIKPLVIEPPARFRADFSFACHPLASALGRSPEKMAEKLALEGVKHPYIRSVRVDGEYVNYEIGLNNFAAGVLLQIEKLGERYGEQNIGNGETVVLDVSSPNIAKRMSVGHLRSTVIGEALSRIYRACGYRVIRDNHLGDWGTQFGMLGHAYALWGKEIPELSNETTAVRGLYKLYVRMNDEIAKEKAANQNEESQLERAGREWFARLEKGDEEAIKLWSWAYKQSLKEFKKVYDLLGSEYEYILGESEYIGMLPAVVSALLKNGIAQKDPTGAVIVYFKDEGKGKLTIQKRSDVTEERPVKSVIQKSDDASDYESRDLATLAARTEWFKPVKIIYVVGEDQISYFQKLFTIFHKWAKGRRSKTEHVYFGMVTLPEGKMSTRAGRVVFLEDVLTEAINKAKEMIITSGKGIEGGEMDTVARQVGVGAVIYSDLKQARERNIKFNWKEALSLEGNSAPYIQYTHARAEAIIRKAAEQGLTLNKRDTVKLDSDIEAALVKQLSRYPQAIKRALAENQPSLVAECVYRVADLFNQFYKQESVLREEDPSKRNSKLRLTAATALVINNGLNLLGIEAPRKM